MGGASCPRARLVIPPTGLSSRPVDPYRQRGDRNRRSQPPSDGVLHRVDVSGHDGLDGRDGARGGDGQGAGADGGRGGDAGRAQRGQAGGLVDVVLRSERGAPGVVSMEGRRERHGGRGADVSRTFEIGDAGFVDLVARGGRGGDGGRGGRGGDGARGRSGSDATRYSSGGDGGPGGDGGDGGRGSHGADGGAGGTVVVRVLEADTPLLMLVRSAVDGGEGGDPGDNGSGGDGGPGGSGGSAYHWTETESYTDSDGNSQTRSTSHSSSGGSRGRPGRRGRSPRAHLAAGSNGADGRFSIVVLDGAQAGTYSSRFELRLASFRHESENRDGIYEPGEKVVVRDLEVKNVGGMPSPAHSEVRVGLVAERWVEPLERELTLPHALWPDQSHRFDEVLEFRVGAFEPSAAGDALAEKERIRLRGHLPEVRREFSTFEREITWDDSQFVVRFPVEVTPIETLYSLAPGEAARVSFSVQNVSRRAFGADSELHRRIAVRVSTVESDLSDASLALFDADGVQLSLPAGLEREIAHLGAGEASQIECTIAVRPGAPAYRSARLRVALALGEIEAPDRTRPIQYREFELRVAERYRSNAAAEILLVVGNRTTEQELSAWRGLAARLGTELAVYDVSLEAGFDLMRLLDDVRDKSVIVLNGLVDTPRGKTRAASMIDKDQLHAAWAQGTHVAFVGKRPQLEPLLLPTRAANAAPRALPEVGDYVDGLAPDVDGGGAVDVFEVSVRLWPLRRASAKALGRIARRLQEALDERYPERRYVVVFEYDPGEVEGSLLSRRCRLGRISVRRTLDAAAGALVSLSVKERALHDVGFVSGDACLMLLLLAASFNQKLRRLERASDDEIVSACERALLVDLANEQVAASRSRWSIRSGKELAKRLELLSACADRAFQDEAPLDPNGDKGRALVVLLALAFELARARVRWWEWLPPFLWLRRAPALRRATKRVVERGLARAFGSDGALGRHFVPSSRGCDKSGMTPRTVRVATNSVSSECASRLRGARWTRTPSCSWTRIPACSTRSSSPSFV